jgi:hypothetical protein
VECKKKVIPVVTGNWNHLKIIQKIPKQHTRKTQNKGIKKKGNVGHYTHTWESTNVKVQNIYLKNNTACTINCNYRTAATVVP